MKERIEQLVKLLNEASKAYYQQDKEIDKKKLLLLTVYFFSRSRYNYITVYLVN